MPLRFLETSVLLRYLTRDDEAKAQKALALLQRLERREEQARSSAIVIFETVYTLQSDYKLPKARIRELLLPVINLRGLRIPYKPVLRRALDFYADRNLSFADAYFAAEMLKRGESEVYSWDEGFKRVEGISRVEPD